MTILHTERLRLEPFAAVHLDGLHAMNSRPEVMQFITGKPETLEETQASIERVQARWAELGYSWWAFVDRQSAQVVGAGCIQHLGRDPANPLEIGWRLHPDHWHQGLASEAALRMASFAFDDLKTPDLLAVRHPDNLSSAKVMGRLGMEYRGIQHWYDEDLAVHGVNAVDWQLRHR
jgi:RimJ/RimL family protein N-acetyltransferase